MRATEQILATDKMQFARDGALRLTGAVASLLPALRDIAATFAPDRAGIRLAGSPALGQLIGKDGAGGIAAAPFIGAEARPVRAILFDKTQTTNWSLGWHQDRTICVYERREVTGFGPWTIKAGMHHVAPPIDVLKRMVTIRIHLDDVPATNAPLLIAPGSHRLGMVREYAIDAVVARCGVDMCLAMAGDIWVYSTPILHASEAAREPARRRVLQVDYAAFDLPGGLIWSGL
ncbi:phytanoyl-CoA dioxygenase family protein [Sphingomonas sp. LT1P40]|uniref:phytanoyl-CoA dioxygenase family protein n=1 Tax=Alteristakelama amylovorans TaxID=3096166 RepID=UPI002FCB5F15